MGLVTCNDSYVQLQVSNWCPRPLNDGSRESDLLTLGLSHILLSAISRVDCTLSQQNRTSVVDAASNVVNTAAGR